MTKFLPLDIFIVLCFLAAGIFLSVKFSHTHGEKVSVLANGKKYAYSLNVDGTHNVEGAKGTTTFEIKGGKVRITDSACPNKNCVRQGFSRTIVCIPNDVIITVGEGDFDAVSR